MESNKEREVLNARMINLSCPRNIPFFESDKEFRILNESNRIEEFPLAMAYVPWQFFESTYDPDKALDIGTIFPELDKPFLGRRGLRQ